MISLSTFRAMKTVSGNRRGLVIRYDRLSACRRFRRLPKPDRLTACRTKAGEPSQLSTGFTFRGDALKGCSEGSWRSGRRRSGEVGGGVTGFNFQFRTCRSLVEHLPCHELEVTRLRSRFWFRDCPTNFWFVVRKGSDSNTTEGPVGYMRQT
jgi:hypothetical protein